MNRLFCAAALATGLTLSASVQAGSSLFFAFTPDSALDQDIGALSPEGCLAEPGLARGRLTRSSAGSTCHSGQWGSDANKVARCGGLVCEPLNYSKAQFDTPALLQPLAVGGTANLVVYYFSGNENHSPFPAAPYPETARARLEYTVEDVPPGAVTIARTIARGAGFKLNPGGTGGVYRGEVTFRIPGYTVPAGHHLRVTVTSTYAPDGRLLFGGAPLASTPAFGARNSYHDAGITLRR